MKDARAKTFWANFVIAAVVISIFALTIYLTVPKTQDVKAAFSAIYSGNELSNKVGLMFNVYENSDLTEQIAETLEQYSFSATFFVGGCFVARHKNTVLKLAACDFEIGNHGYLHRDHAKLGVVENENEIRLTERLIDDILKDFPDRKNCRLFAPPSGSMGKEMFKACENLGYKVIMWTRDTVDWRDHDENVIFERAVNGLKAGDLILMHPTQATLKALPRILEKLVEKGLVADKVSNVINAD